MCNIGHLARGGSAPPSTPLRTRAPAECAGGGHAGSVSPVEFADWRAKALATGVPLSALLREAMARTRTWTAPAAAVERERTRQVARIGNNLNQIARWANTYASTAEAVEVVAHLVAIDFAVFVRVC